MAPFDTTPVDIDSLRRQVEEINLRGQITNIVNEIKKLDQSIANQQLGNRRTKATHIHKGLIVDVAITQTAIEHKKVQLMLLGTSYEYEVQKRNRNPWS